VFAGISLQGATLRQDLDENQSLYGHRITNKQIVMKKDGGTHGGVRTDRRA
jgi:lipid-binding SYLF domain-containing protein